MKSCFGFILFLASLLVSCNGTGTLPVSAATPTLLTQPPEVLAPSLTAVLPSVTSSAVNLPDQPGTDCADEKVNKLGEAIAASYSFTNAQKVMTWFCDGAEFEDILTALESEELTGMSAEDLLLMRADGLSWDEIWEVIGLYDD